MEGGREGRKEGRKKDSVSVYSRISNNTPAALKHAAHRAAHGAPVKASRLPPRRHTSSGSVRYLWCPAESLQILPAVSPL